MLIDGPPMPTSSADRRGSRAAALNHDRPVGALEMRILAGGAANADAGRARVDQEGDKAIERLEIELSVFVSGRDNRGEETGHRRMRKRHRPTSTSQRPSRVNQITL